MGIDFDFVRKPKDVTERYRRLRTEMVKAGSGVALSPRLTRLTQEVRERERHHRSSCSYPWRDWWPIMTAMNERGGLANVPPAPRPDLAALGYDRPCAYEALYDPAASREVQVLVWDWLAQIPSVPGIARFKLVSNDWWIVTPAEARSAIRLLGSHPAPDIDGWDEWIEFVMRSIDHDGFQVS